MTPNFDEIIGGEPSGAERERLRRVHELLVEAGPPPEITPQLEASAAMRDVRSRQLRRVKRRSIVLLAAAVSAGAFFGIGYGIASSRGGPGVAATIGLKGTRFAPHAQATLQVDREVSGNWPMSLSVSGLPALPAHTFYEVYLVRNGKPYASCGTFTVGKGSRLTLTLNAPYTLRHGDTWVVTRQSPGDGATGPVVLRPI